MRTAIWRLAGAIVPFVVSVLVVGCGSTAGSASTAHQSGAAAHPKGRSAEFRGSGIATEIVEFGTEAAARIGEEASPTLAKNLKARAAGDWSGQCATLSTKEAKKLGKDSTSTNVMVACEEGLRKLGTPLKKTEAARADTFGGQIDAMRVKGDIAYALYHGTDGTEYMMPMEQEHGEWKVASIETVTLN
jgi:hypothetical protein